MQMVIAYLLKNLCFIIFRDVCLSPPDDFLAPFLGSPAAAAACAWAAFGLAQSEGP